MTVPNVPVYINFSKEVNVRLYLRSPSHVEGG